MDLSPIAPVSYRNRASSPVQKVSYLNRDTSQLQIVTPKRKQRKSGYQKRKPAPKAVDSLPSLPEAVSLPPTLPQTPVRSIEPDDFASLSLSFPSPNTFGSPTNETSTSAITTPTVIRRGQLTPSARFALRKAGIKDGYPSFVEAVFSEECAFYQLELTLFVANGWNFELAETHGWYHLQRSHTGLEDSIVCMCPDARSNLECFHSKFLKEYGNQRFPDDDTLPNLRSSTYLISRVEDLLVEDGFINHFSVSSHSEHSTVKSRVVVEHRGDDAGGGTWTCTRDSSTSCAHIIEARNALQRLLKCDPTATDVNARSDPNAIKTPLRSAAGINNSISFKVLPPPVWATIDADNQLTRPPVMRTAPTTISLDNLSSCPCKSPRIGYYDSSRPVEVRQCVLYGLLEGFSTKIEIQKCPACPHGFIGPDGIDIGIFNFNNRSLFTLTLLDDYTSHFTKSETPFVSWVASTACRYQNYNSPIPFIKEKVFRLAWFSYARLLQLDQDMSCPQCGPTPKVTIWDGVTLSFSRKNLLSTLKPPTSTDDRSEQRSTIRLESNLQFIAERALRKDIIYVLSGPSLELPAIPKDSVPPTQSVINMMKRITSIPNLITRLSDLHISLGHTFEQWFGPDRILQRLKLESSYKELFLQLAAEETALQFLNGDAMHNLELFLVRPTKANLFLLCGCPALYQAVNTEFRKMPLLSQQTLNFLQWVLIRASVVYGRLTKYGYPKSNAKDEGDQDWQQTGSCYGMPKVRSRSVYPAIPSDNAADLGGTDLRGEGCQKFYSTYGENRLTGGLMCVWCPHSVCYGFHIIPFAEGRNDVFSAIYTHWQTAPRVIVYDFACALQPYCMTREPEFFANTLFVIDAFHAKGHVKCGKASFLTNYLETNPDLIMVNSSAGECGNSGILRI
ncbi:hypothetical protein CPB83DRAFT_898984 [Crepidotus variabilis]|uniref:HMG domain-containing protein n=1 Tax=Crepidotus variabilis TaxID=179855 RepID=A0A9P6E5W0_9AGAR|nr:hypothetical protein CPB83DRAFT_898984 [Crepidotus variabilis]